MTAVVAPTFASRVERALGAYDRRTLEVPSRTRAAVLVPLFEREGEAWVVLTRRTASMSTHAGQISFPGGSADPGEDDLWDTARRETCEELGVAPGDVARFGVLDDYPTYSSGFIVSAYVGSIVPPELWSHSEREIDEVIELPLRRLAEVGRMEVWERDGIRFPMHLFDIDGHRVWGVTAYILRRFFDVAGHAVGLDKKWTPEAKLWTPSE